MPAIQGTVGALQRHAAATVSGRTRAVSKVCGSLCVPVYKDACITLILGVFVHYIPPSCTSSPCNLLFLNPDARLFSHVPPVSVWMPQ